VGCNGRETNKQTNKQTILVFVFLAMLHRGLKYTAYFKSQTPEKKINFLNSTSLLVAQAV
jgi:hypothetical protein